MNLRLPSYWGGVGRVAKAAYLVNTHQASDFSHACSLLSKRRRPKPAKYAPVVARLPYAD